MRKVYVARDKNGGLYFYTMKPYKAKRYDEWLISDKNEIAFQKAEANNKPKDMDVFDNVKWEDDEPTVILICK